MNALQVLSGWVHVSAAAVGVGGIVFLRLVLLPSLAGLDEPARAALMPQVQRRFKRFVHSVIGLLILTGSYNVWAGWGRHPHVYHALLGAKLLLALAMFTLSILLTLPPPGPGWIARHRPRWLLANLALGLAIIGLSAALRRLP